MMLKSVVILFMLREVFPLKQGDCPSGLVKCEKGANWRKDENNIYPCINKTSECDDILDCTDGSDEAYCPGNFNYKRNGFVITFIQGPCPSNHYLCLSGKHKHSGGIDDKRCVEESWMCDGAEDCNDDSDETYCPLKVSLPRTFNFSFTQEDCPENYYRCRVGKPNETFYSQTKLDCIPKRMICDGTIHCQDNSDEHYCPYVFDKNKESLKEEIHGIEILLANYSSQIHQTILQYILLILSLSILCYLIYLNIFKRNNNSSDDKKQLLISMS